MFETSQQLRPRSASGDGRRGCFFWAWRPLVVAREKCRWPSKRARGPFGKGAVAACALLGWLGSGSIVEAQFTQFFRIGTASTAGTYFPIGGIIASAISNPLGSRDCARGGSCGVPGMIAVAQSTNGSVENVEAIGAGSLESGFSQADVAYWAYHGTGIFEEQSPISDLRAIANLFPESLHFVVRADSGISQVADIRGKRISLDREGSGTMVDAFLVLEAYGISPDDFEVSSVAAGTAVDLMRVGELDGFFFVAGTPANAVAELARSVPVRLVPITGAEAEELVESYPFFAPEVIPAGTYWNVPATPTLSVGALWVVSAEVADDTVYEIVRALWNESTRQLLDNGHPKGRLIRLETALDGVSVPLHPGAERYYREVGAFK